MNAGVGDASNTESFMFPNQSLLYVNDSRKHCVYSCQVRSDGTVKQ